MNVVQRFRECQNLLPKLTTNLSALENITRQKVSLEGAVRRTQQCFTTTTTSTEDTRMDGARRTTCVAVEPVGVLAAFAPSTTELLVGQHQDDQNRLLAAIAQVQQSWQQKTQQVRSLLDQMEALRSSSLTTAATPNETPRTASSRTSLATAYGVATSPTVALSSSAAAAVCSGNAPRGSYRSVTGLASSSQLLFACHGLLAALVKMASILQEGVLALRHDLLRDLAGCSGEAAMTTAAQAASAPAQAEMISAWMARERVATRYGALPWAPTDARANGSAQTTFTENSSAWPTPGLQLTLLDALAEMEDFIDSRWAVCQVSYLGDDAWMLLST